MSDKALAKKLIGANIRVAIKAGRMLAKRKEVTELLKVLHSEEGEHRKRALAVLHSIKWEDVHSAQKKLAVRAIFPHLLKFDMAGRSTESFYAEAAMIKIGDEAMPAFTSLVKGGFIGFRMLGFSALENVDWRRTSPAAALGVKEELEGIKADETDAFRYRARGIIVSISKVYRWCEKMNSGVNLYGKKAA